MYMDDIKLLGRNIEGKFIPPIQTVRIVSVDIRMEFSIESCVLANILSKGTQVPELSNIIDIEETGYKYLRVLEVSIMDIKNDRDREEIYKEDKNCNQISAECWKYGESHEHLGSTSHKIHCSMVD